MAKLQVVVDGWVPDEGGDYSPEEFYVRSTNQHDHSESVRLRLPVDLLQQASALVQGGQIPEYSTLGAVMRDALVHRMWFVSQLIKNDELKRYLHLEMSLAQADRAKREIDLALKTIRTWDETLNAIRQAGDVELMAIQLSAVEMVVEGWREPYRQRLQEVVDRYRKT